MSRIAHATPAQELVQSCRIALKSLSGSGSNVSIAAAGVECWNYMEAVQDMIVLADESGRHLLGVCAPEDGKIDDLLRVFTRYAAAHPQELGERASVVILEALGASYPCK